MVTDGWYLCPVCGKRILKILPDSIMYNMPVWCRSCKFEWFPTIFNGQELGDDDPFPLYATDK